MKNQDECGELVELAIRKFLREVIGERFKITHGYIYSSKYKKLSPQIDIIITDKLVPHSLKRFEHLDNLELIPVEAVVAIFEVKRTLYKSSYKSAGEHLEKIFNDVPLSKERQQRYLPGGVELKSKGPITIEGGKYSNPMIGIIGLLHEESIDWSNLPWFVDIIFSFQGFLRATKNTENDSLQIFAKRTPDDKIDYREIVDVCDEGRVKLLKGFSAYLLQYLNEVSGRTFDMNDYFS